MMTWTTYLEKSLATDVQEAAAFLRLALREAGEDPQGLLLAVRQIVQARGGIDDLGLSDAEKIELASALSRSLVVEPLPQAA